MKIKQKLIIAFLAISLIPIFIIGSLFFTKSKAELMEARLSSLESIADLKVKTLEEVMDNLRKDMEIAQDYLNIKINLPVLTRLADDRESPAFMQAKKNLDSQLKTLAKIKGFEDIMLTSPEGIVRYVVNEKHVAMDINQPLSDKMVFEKGKRGVYFSKIVKIRSGGDNEMLIAAPAHGPDGRFIGIIIFEVDMAPIYQLIQDRTGLGNTGETLIGRNMGEYALFLSPTHYDLNAALRRKAMYGNPNAYPMQEAVQGRSNSGVSLDYRGKEILAVWRYIPSMDWGIVAKIDASEAFESISALKTLTFISVGIIVVIMVLIAIAIARTFSRPILSLREGIEIIGKGNLDYSLGTDRKDEIGELSQAFDEMTKNLKIATTSRDELETEMAERAQAEKLLRESEARTRAIVETMGDAMITIDKSAIVESFNPAAERIFGYTPDEVIGNNVKMLMPEPYKHEHDGYLRHYLDTGEAKVIGIAREAEGRRKDGSAFPIELSISEMDIGGRRSFSGIIRDISERRAADQAIAEKNRELELRGHYDHSYAKAMALFSSTYDRDKALSGLLSILAGHHPYPVSAIYTYDEWSGRLELAVSHGAPDTLKSEFEHGEGLIGQVAVEGKLSLLDEVDAKSGLAIETGILKFKPAAVIAVPISFQDKLLGVLVLAASKPLIDLDGSFIERLVIQLGVAMNNIRQYGDLKALSDQLKQRGEEIAQKNSELEKANRMKSEFLANMSHELRTPLNAIIGFSEVLKDGIMGEMSKEQTEYIGDIFDSGHHLLSLINDILDLSKIEAGRMELNLGNVDVPELLGNSMSIIREKAMAHHIKLNLDIGDEVETCRMDARRAKQMVYNLLSNAIKFTPDGGSVRIAARRVRGKELGVGSKGQPSALAPPTSQNADFLEISVADTGIGISREDQERLFRPFTQVDSSLSRKFEGTGLGLVMVKRLAELHGGAVAVESEEGRGSTFTVWLPYREANGDEDETVPRPVRTMAKAKPGEDAPLVLIIEDDSHAADLMRVQLEDEGYRSFRVATAEDGLDWLKDNTPDLISLDVLLPGMDGWDFLTEMKKRESAASIPVVIVSIVADGNERKAISLGASSVLQKPVRKKQLIEAILALGFSCGGAGRPLKVLVVDDDPKAVELVSRHLESGRCTALRAYGGAEAIDTAIREHPDLIVLDLMMPEVTGFDVVNALKGKEETKNIPIIILTAKVITEQDRKELNSGVLKIIGKDGFHHSSFLAEIRRASGGVTAKADEVGTERQGEKDERPLVLVVEDNPRDAQLLKCYLEDSGHEVMIAANGHAALEAMSKTRPDIITLDMRMPGMTGLAFLNEKARHSEFANIPVVIVSGVSETQKGLSLGTHAILQKPLRKRQLLDVIASLNIKSGHKKRPRILLVDDDPKAIKVISSCFDAAMFEVVPAYNGRACLEEVAKSTPDLILLDLMMPDMNGFEVIDDLKHDEKTRAIPIVVITAMVLQQRERNALARQVQAIQEKGCFDRQRFLAEVETLLRKKHKQ